MLYDVVIVGGGPAGLTAAIYSLRACKKVLLIEKFVPGGQVVYTSTVENYPGIRKIDGASLAENMYNHAKDLGLQVVFSYPTEYDFSGKIKKIKTYEGTFEGKTVILCLGASARELNLANEKKFIGKGVSYCATCDGNFYKGKSVAVVGGGNSSLEDVIYLLDIAKKVYLITRKEEFCGDNVLISQIDSKKNKNIEVLKSSIIKEINGEEKLEELIVENLATKKERKIKVDGLFVAIGRKPDTDMLKDKISLDENGYIITNEKMETSQPGVYAAGDVRQKQLRQIVTATSDGAIASINTNEYILKNFGG